MNTRKSVFNFNHINKNIDSDELTVIKSLYKHHKKFWCDKQSFKIFKRLNLIINISSTGFITIGTITGLITLNLIVLGIISGTGLLLKTFGDIKDYKKKLNYVDLLIQRMKNYCLT